MTQDLVSRLRDEAARSTMCALAHGNQMRRESDRVNPAAVMRESADALERLQADTERLEWIEGELRAHGAVSLGRDRYVAGRGYIGLVGLFSVTSQHVAGDDVRAAIDAARSSDGPAPDRTASA